nr:immunoglobulin light chain junction region [Macaca mulatta]
DYYCAIWHNSAAKFF